MRVFLFFSALFFSHSVVSQNITAQDLIANTVCESGSCFSAYFEGLGFKLVNRIERKGIERWYCTDPSINLSALAPIIHGEKASITIMEPARTIVFLWHDDLFLQEKLLGQIESLGFVWQKEELDDDGWLTQSYESDEFSGITIITIKANAAIGDSTMHYYIFSIERLRSI